MQGIAIIGQGNMARTHAKAWSSLVPEAQIKYVCALKHGKSRDYASSARFVTDIDIVLSDPDIEIISICTPTPTHADIATRALNAGKNVLLEKPVALNIREAATIRRAAQASRGLLMVAHVVRFFASYRQLRESAANGLLGSVVSARAQRISSAPNASPWWQDESQSGGVIVDFGIHDFDQMNLFLGNPVSVIATRTSPSGPIETTIDYQDGGVGQILSFMGMPESFPFNSSLQLVGTNGIAECRFLGPTKSSPLSPMKDEDGSVTGLQTFQITTADELVSTEFEGDDPYVRQAEYFLECVEKGRQPTLCSLDGAILALAVSLAGRQSLLTGERATVQQTTGQERLATTN